MGTYFSAVWIKTHFSYKKKSIWKCCLQNSSHFISASVFLGVGTILMFKIKLTPQSQPVEQSIIIIIAAIITTQPQSSGPAHSWEILQTWLCDELTKYGSISLLVTRCQQQLTFECQCHTYADTIWSSLIWRLLCSIQWDIITHPSPRYLLLETRSSYFENNSPWDHWISDSPSGILKTRIFIWKTCCSSMITPNSSDCFVYIFDKHKSDMLMADTNKNSSGSWLGLCFYHDWANVFVSVTNWQAYFTTQLCLTCWPLGDAAVIFRIHFSN